VQRGVNDHTVLELVERFRGTGVIVRFIEYMDVGNRNHWRSELVVPSKELAELIGRRWPLSALEPGYRGEWRGATPSRRPGRGGIHLVGVAAVLRRLLACAPVIGRRTLQLPVRHPRHQPARCLRGARRDDALLELIRGVWLKRSDRYSELRASRHAAPPEQRKVEMFYIGG